MTARLDAMDLATWGEGTRAHRTLSSAIEHWAPPRPGPGPRKARPAAALRAREPVRPARSPGLADVPLQDRIKASMAAVDPAHARVVGRCLGLDGRALPPAAAAAQEGVPEAQVRATLDAAMAAIQAADGWPSALRDMLVAAPRASMDDLCDEPWARSMPETSVATVLAAVARLTGTPLREMLPRA